MRVPARKAPRDPREPKGGPMGPPGLLGIDEARFTRWLIEVRSSLQKPFRIFPNLVKEFTFPVLHHRSELEGLDVYRMSSNRLELSLNSISESF